jgi:D-alanine-D-alanine ligase
VTLAKDTRIMVLMGGWSAEREVALAGGAAVLEALKGGGYTAEGYDMAPGGDQMEAVAALLAGIRGSRTQVVYLALHGTWGEDGCIQGLLETAGVPYTGSGVTASAVAMDKAAAKLAFVASRIATPRFEVIPRGHVPPGPPFPVPVVVKPRAQGSSVGVSIVDSDAEFPAAVEKAHACGGDALVEAFVTGRELQACIMDGEPLPLIEIISKNRFYDYDAKYTPGKSEHRLPAPIPPKQYQAAQRLGVAAHQALGCEGVTRVEMIAEATGTLYVIEVNTLPGMTATSLVPESAREAGMSFLDVVVRQIESGLRRQARGVVH